MIQIDVVILAGMLVIAFLMGVGTTLLFDIIVDKEHRRKYEKKQL